MTSNKFAPVILLLILFCGFRSQEPRKTISGDWLLVCISDIIQGKTSHRPTNYKTNQLLFEFKDDGEFGEEKGVSTVNSVRGSYQLFDNQKIEVTSFGGTKIAEHGWGSHFCKNIRRATSYRYSSDTLLIFFDSDKRALKFIPK
jgi:hypothetical protein